jgi:Undecaprenyl-phosphate glucose phosphotransferase|nr:undecaprenyl-phosphate glucose phosphotransferase [Panacagrimonas sp.]
MRPALAARRRLRFGRRGWLRGVEGAVATMFVLEFTAVFAAGVGATTLGTIDSQVSLLGYVLASLFCAGAFVLMLDYQKLYEQDRLLATWRFPVPVIAAAAVAFGALTVSAWAVSGHLSYDLDWLLGFVLLAILVTLLLRVSFASLMASGKTGGLFTRNVILIGAGAPGLRLLEQIHSTKQPWTRVLGVFDDRARDRSGRIKRRIHGARVLGTVKDALTFSRRMCVDDVIVALPWSAQDRIKGLVRSIESISANIHLAPETVGISVQEQRLMVQDGVPALKVSRTPVSGANYVLKRTMDLFICICAMVVLMPLLLLVALCIKAESRGPVLFRQPRYGINNRTIHVLKFRSMYHDQQDLHASRLATRNDPRVTRVGRFLRRSSLDELPQLFNVLLGEMSIVGPRPHAKNAKAAGRTYQEVVQEYAHRHRIKPGITGWAQFNGWRGETDTEEKIIRRCEHDLYYIDNWSVFLDLYIIAGTLVRAPFQRNVY